MAASLNRPGGNLTGLFIDFPELSGKHLQFLKEVKPNAARVAVLGDARVNELQTAARAAGLELLQFLIKSSNEIPIAIA